MSIIRLIHITYPPDRADEAARRWKDKCGPLLTQQTGCQSEMLLRCKDVPNEFVSYSEWDNEESIRTYLESDAYQQIRAHHLEMGGGDVSIRLYNRA
jgi:heme-degrading monooxygenase HmoA